jgi:hypothetical protein
MAEYARPEMLVSTEWLAQHLHDPGLRIVEVDVDTSAYDLGTYPWCGRLELANPALRPSPARYPDQGAI